jgi:alpha-tubulin suppressor-like RCC1 family protein
MAFISQVEGDLTEYFVTDYETIDQYAQVGSLWTWGNGQYGQLGNNNSAVFQVSSPVQIVGSSINWKQVSSSYAHVAAIKTDGTLWSWGYNLSGALGDGTTVDKSSPVQTTAGGTNWKQVSVGQGFTHAIKTDGTLWVFGYGQGASLTQNTQVSTPIQIGSDTTWKKVFAGGGMVAGIKTNGTLWTWGLNYKGSLGIGNSSDSYYNNPRQVGTQSNWVQAAFSSTDAYSSIYGHLMAINNLGELWACGHNSNGKLGDGTTTDTSTPIQVGNGTRDWKQVSCGLKHTAAIKTDGTLWSWGDNNHGKLGTGISSNTLSSASTPVQVYAGGTDWKQVSSAGGGVMGYTYAIKTDGTLWVWGDNQYGGMLGIGSSASINVSSPVQIGTNNKWKQISASESVPAAIYFNS